MSRAYPAFNTTRCTRFRFRYSECTRCSDACPHEAIALSDAGATLDTAHCRNCGLCISACRTNAWTSETYAPIDLLRQAIRRETWSYACAPSAAQADAIVPCLGAIDAATLAYLAKRGIPTVLHGAWHCAECVHGTKGAAQLALNLEGYEVLHAAASSPQAPAWHTPVLAPAPTGSVRTTTAHSPGRRQLFRRIVGRGIDEAVRADPQASEPIPDKAIRAGAYLNTEQRELLQIVCKRADDQPTSVTLHDALPLMQLSLMDGCTVCEACMRACPTGAIDIEENPTDWALRFSTDRCVGCMVCMEVCQPRVLDAQTEFDVRPDQPPRVLRSMSKQRCARCDRHFVSVTPQTTCPVCRDDEDAFDAIFGHQQRE